MRAPRVVPSTLTTEKSVALAEGAILNILEHEASDAAKLKAAELILTRRDQGELEKRGDEPTREDIAHLGSIIGEVKTVLEGHVGFIERKFSGRPETCPSDVGPE